MACPLLDVGKQSTILADFFGLGFSTAGIGTGTFAANNSAARIWTFPDASGTVSLEGHTHDDRYYTETEIDAQWTAHLAAGDPHPGYLTQAEADALYSVLGHTHVEADITDLNHTDPDAIHDNVAGEIAAVTLKASPVSADLLLIEDSADSNNKKRVTIGSLPGGGSVALNDLTDVTISGVATGDYLRKSAGDWLNVTVTQLLTDLKTVDGTGSGLDADLLDGNEATAFAAASHTHAAADVTSGTFDDARIAQSNVTQHEAAIDHDALTNFVANEHVKIATGTDAARGTAAAFGVGFYWATDTARWSYSNASTWVELDAATLEGFDSAAFDPAGIAASLVTTHEATYTHPSFVGDSGAGGTAGTVPGPSAGDAALDRYLSADGSWETPSIGDWTFRFSTDVAATDPGAGYIKFNHATTPTNIYVNDRAYDVSYDFGYLVNALASGAKIIVYQKSDPTKFAGFYVNSSVSDNTGWWTIPVATDDLGTFPDNNAVCGIIVLQGSSGSNPTHPNVFQFDTATGAANPGAGNFRLNTGNFGTATNLYINDQDTDQYNLDGVLGNQVILGWRMRITNRNNTTQWVEYSITANPTDNTGWWTIGINWVNDGSGGTVPAASDPCLIEFYPPYGPYSMETYSGIDFIQDMAGIYMPAGGPAVDPLGTQYAWMLAGNPPGVDDAAGFYTAVPAKIDITRVVIVTVDIDDAGAGTGIANFDCRIMYENTPAGGTVGARVLAAAAQNPVDLGATLQTLTFNVPGGTFAGSFWLSVARLVATSGWDTAPGPMNVIRLTIDWPMAE